MFAFWVVGILILGLSSCVSPQKLVEHGNYEEAINVAVRKLAGKKKKKEKYVMALEDAFQRATARDMREARRLKNSGRPENWVKALAIYQTIRKRQAKIEPLLPVIAKNGVKANFKFVDVANLEMEAENQTISFYYKNGKSLLAQATSNNDKMAARKAYKEFSKIQNYAYNYKDTRDLMRNAYAFGTTHILLEVKNRAPVVFPSRLMTELKHFNVKDLDDEWHEYHQNAPSGVPVDYKVVINIMDANVSPELVKEREFEESKEIEEGFEYVLDSNGNVMKDTLGNDVKIPKKIYIKARVFETYQHKDATLSVRMDVYSVTEHDVLESQNFTADAIFDNYASTYSGDKRALTKETLKRIGNRPVEFPPNEVLLLDAVQDLKPMIKNRVSRSRTIL